MTNAKEQALQLISASSRLGVTCRTTGATILGYSPDQLDRQNATELMSSKEGAIMLANRVAIRIGSPGWIAMQQEGVLPVGSIVSIAKGLDNEKIVSAKESRLDSVLLPSIIIGHNESGHPIVAYASPKAKQWEVVPQEHKDEHALATLSLHRMFGGGIELEHMLTRVIANIISGKYDEIDLISDSHDIHHSKLQAKEAIATNIMRGRATIALATLNSQDIWIFVTTADGRIAPRSVQEKLTDQEQINVLASGIATAATTIYQTGQFRDNTQLTVSGINHILIDQGISLAESASKGGANIRTQAEVIKNALNKSKF